MGGGGIPRFPDDGVATTQPSYAERKRDGVTIEEMSYALYNSVLDFTKSIQRDRLRDAVRSAIKSATRRKKKAEAAQRRAVRGWTAPLAPEEQAFSRQFHCLIVEEVATQRIVGCAFVFLYRAEAGSPPPFPTNAPLRMYLSNLAVADGYRGRGVASALVREVEKGKNEMNGSGWAPYFSDKILLLLML